MLRGAAILLAAPLVATCHDAPTAVRSSHAARLAVQPVFQAGESAAGLVIDRVRLIVRRPQSEGPPLLDRTFEFPSSGAGLTIDEAVELQGASEELDVRLSLLSGTTELFEGTTLAVVTAGIRDPPAIAIVTPYVGPGADVDFISLSPRDTIVRFGGRLAFRVDAFDAQENRVDRFFVFWSSDNSALVPDPTGTLQAANARATVRVTARTPSGVSASTDVTIVAPPASLVKTGGDAQTAGVGARLALPLEVEVRGTDDLPVPGAEVTFASSNGGAVDVAQVTTDAGGRARTGARLGPGAGPQGFTATVAGIPVATFTATATVPAPEASFTTAAQTVAEGTQASLVVQLTSATTVPVTVPYTISGTASAGDFTIAASPLVIPAGATSASIAITVASDGVAEPSETIVVTMGTPTNAQQGEIVQHIVSIPAQAPSVAFTAAAQSVSEAAGTATITAQLSQPSTAPVTVPFSVSGTATSPADFTITASPLTIAAGTTSATITVNVLADGVAEPDETVIVTMGTPTGATAGAPTVHTLTITGQGTSVSFATASQATTEGVTVTIPVQLSTPTTQAVTVPFTLSGSASAGDFTASASPVTIAAGATTANITIDVASDGVAEPDETIVVTLGTPTGATLGAITTHAVAVAAQLPSVAFALAAQTVAEGTTNATIVVQLSGASTQAVSVPFTVSGTAGAGDFTIGTSPPVIAAGSTSASITLAVAADGVAELAETIVVTMGTPANATLGTPSVHTVTIPGQSPSLSWTAAAQSANEGTTATVTAQLSSPSTQPVSVPFTVSGSASDADFEIGSSPLVIPAGSTTASVTVTIADDGVAEPSETIVVTMGAPAGARAGATTVHTITIGAQVATVRFATASQAAAEGTTATVTVELSNPSANDVTVPYTVSGTASAPADFSVSPNPLVIPAGSTSGAISVVVAGDELAEPDETVVLTLGTPTGATTAPPTQHTLTILGQSASVSFAAAAQAGNEGATVAVTLQLSSPTTVPVSVPFTVGGTASAGDFSVAASPLVIPAGATSATMNVVLAADAVAEPDETIVLTLGTPTGATLGGITQHVITIAGQSATVSFTTAAQSATEGATATLTVQLSAASSQDVSVPFTVSGTAGAGDFTIDGSPVTVTAGNTTATIAIPIAADGLAEPDETIAVTLGTPANAVLGTPSQHVVTITGQVPSVRFALAAQSVAENAGEVAIRVDLSSPSAGPVVVPFMLGGTATGGADYNASTSPLTIPAGATSGIVTISIANDAVSEPDETIVATLGTPTGATLGAVTVHTLTITGQLPSVTFTSGAQTAAEGASATITAQLSAPSTQEVSIPVIVSGTATALIDYNVTAATVTIAAGGTTASVTLNILDDGIAEPDETIVVTMGTPVNATRGAITQHVVTIPAQVPAVSFDAGTEAVNEADGTAILLVVLSAPSTQAVTVPFTVTGTATSGADFTISASPVTIPAGGLFATIGITVADDGVAEPDETIVVTMGSPVGAVIGSPGVHVLTILEQVPTVRFTTAAQVVGEGTTATITAQLSTPSTQPVTVPFTVAGSASNPADYTITSSPLTIPAGATSASITVSVATDGVAEPDEVVQVTMGTPTNAFLGAPVQHTLTISGQGTSVSFATASQSGNEGATVTIPVRLSTPSTQAVTVPYTVGGDAGSGDFNSSGSPVTIPAGATAANITLTLTTDGVAEPEEFVIVTLGTPTGATLGAIAQHVVTINAQLPSIAFTSAAQQVPEGQTANVAVQLSSPSTRDVSVPFTFAGSATFASDYTLAIGVIIVPAGATTATLAVPIVADGLAEPTETIVLTLGSPANATLGTVTQHTITIPAQAVTVSFAAASQVASEGVTAAIVAQLSSPASTNVTVPFTLGGTATNGTDYSISASPLVIPAGATLASITVTVVADAVAEPDETVVVTMGTPTNATTGSTPVHTLTIAAQVPSVSFDVVASSANEGTAATVTARLSGVSSQPVTVPFTVTGTATNPADYTVTASPVVIPAGITFAVITVTTAVDAIFEPDETVIVTMGTPTNATRGAITQQTVTIIASLPGVTVGGATTTAPEGATTNMVVAISGVSSVPVTVPFTLSGTATSGADYTTIASPVVIPAGSTSATIAFTVTNDGVAEPNETIVLQLGQPVNGFLATPNQRTLTIPAQVPNVTFFNPAVTAFENSGTVMAIATLSQPSTLPVSVPLTLGGTAVNGTDYTLNGTLMTIPPGSSADTIFIFIVNDAVTEPDETVVLTMGTPTNATAQGNTQFVLTIRAPVPVVSFGSASQSISEGGRQVTVPVQLSAPSAQTVTVPFSQTGSTASASFDYSITGSAVSFPSGTTSLAIVVNITDDGLDEGLETVVLTLGNSSGAIVGTPSVHTVTILDDDEVLRVLFSGRGSGSVATQPGLPAINCTTGDPPASCTQVYPTGLQVSLTATPTPTGEGIFRFERWTGTGTGFTCTTSPTCTVPMTQNRDVTAQFSTIGTITFSPTPATFSQLQDAAVPPPLTVAMRNTGERPVNLDPTPRITFQAGVTPWMTATLDRLTVDTLTPGGLTLTILAAKLPAGVYTASVLVLDSGSQFSWTLPVTLTVAPPGPVISNIRVTLIQLNDASRCTLGTPAASSFQVDFDWSDATGNGPLNIGGSGLSLTWLFQPRLDAGGFPIPYTFGSSLSGDGRSGTARTTQCYRYGSNTSVDVTMSLADQGGVRGPNASVTIPRPPGSN